jgi:putative transposase
MVGQQGWHASFVLDALEQALHDRRPVHRGGLIHRRGPWLSFEAVVFATLEWVDWFNNRRLLEPIGNIPPAEPSRYTTPCWTTSPSQRN